MLPYTSRHKGYPPGADTPLQVSAPATVSCSCCLHPVLAAQDFLTLLLPLLISAVEHTCLRSLLVRPFEDSVLVSGAAVALILMAFGAVIKLLYAMFRKARRGKVSTSQTMYASMHVCLPRTTHSIGRQVNWLTNSLFAEACVLDV